MGTDESIVVGVLSSLDYVYWSITTLVTFLEALNVVVLGFLL